MSVFPLIILPMLIIGSVLFAFSTQISSLQTVKNRAFCQWPDYNTGINNSTVMCSGVHHPDPYSCNSKTFLTDASCKDKFVLWNFTIPQFLFYGGSNSTSANWLGGFQTGWAGYVVDILTSLFYRGYNIGVGFLTLVTFPATISGLSWMLIPEGILIIWLILGMVITFKIGG